MKAYFFTKINIPNYPRKIYFSIWRKIID